MSEITDAMAIYRAIRSTQEILLYSSLLTVDIIAKQNSAEIHQRLGDTLNNMAWLVP